MMSKQEIQKKLQELEAQKFEISNAQKQLIQQRQVIATENQKLLENRDRINQELLNKSLQVNQVVTKLIVTDTYGSISEFSLKED